MDNRIAKVIGENIRKRIDEKGLLMREVAAEVNVLEHTFLDPTERPGERCRHGVKVRILGIFSA